ncbi:MAG: PIN domain-containing protein [Thermodesulfovibrionales bacterium]
MREEEVVLIDTSSWIEALRQSGNTEVRERVASLMLSGRAAWCEMVIVELWNGARGDYEKQRLRALEQEILLLPITPDVWQTAKTLAQKCRQSGQTVPSADLVISACALFHNVSIEHCDDHIDFILKARHARKRKE